ncbi:MFS transporter, partial [Achromobacter xylosoxidans]
SELNAILRTTAIFGVGFFMRPVGGIILGLYGDKKGRKAAMVLVTSLMAVSIALITVAPTYHAAGILAPVMLVGLRVLQGFSAGGEWGGAALMAVEHAPTDRRSLFGAFPQIGVPLGMIVATGALWCITTLVGAENFMAWGWRISFLLSIALIIVGVFIRRAVE